MSMIKYDIFITYMLISSPW